MLEDLDKNELIEMIKNLQSENTMLKEKIYGKLEKQEKVKITTTISNDEKVKIFMELFKGRIIQYVGRLHRKHEGKEKVVVYDYLDNMKILEKMYSRRLKGYKIAGYRIIEEGE